MVLVVDRVVEGFGTVDDGEFVDKLGVAVV